MMEVNQQWKNFFDRDILRDSVNIIALYITMYELLEDTLISRPKDFFTVLEYDERAKKQYEEHVLSLYDKSACLGIATKNKELIASLLWFKKMDAIDDDDIQVFTNLRTTRNEVTHQMLHAIAEGGERYLIQLMELYKIFCKIERWWILEMEIPLGDEIPPDKEIKEEDVMSGNMIILNVMIDILANDSNANYKEVCEAIGVPVK